MTTRKPSLKHTGWGERKYVGRLKMTLAYDGRPFRGWQSQAEGHGVQDYLERALAVLCQRPVSVQGSGRTDTGVHALGQVAHADVESDRFPIRQWRAAINAQLPPEIRVMRCSIAKPDFHARYSAKGKIYRYLIWNDQVMPPLMLGRCWHVHKPLDLELMRQHAQLMVGTHDFAAFAANRGFKERTTVRTVNAITIRNRGPQVSLTFEGQGFLYHQVRLMVGGLERANQPGAPPDDIPRRLEAGAALKCQHAVPATGLYLVRVMY